MKNIILFLCFCTSYPAFSQYDLSKVATIDSTIHTLYSVISGEKGAERDWDLFHFLFADNAQLIPTRVTPNEAPQLLHLNPDGYIERSGAYLVENGFYEIEINRVSEQYGSLAHVFSTYESYRSKSDTEPFMRGINSIQLLFADNRWWVVNIYWLAETKDNPIPEKYLPKK